jgi:2-furoyl-CoA dehydrogenase 2Fe-2S iron sulfur subunit
MSRHLHEESQPLFVKLTLNGKERTGYCEPRTTLCDFIRHDLGATGTHVGCEHGVCGACTVSLDGLPVRSCLMFAFQAQGLRVNTVEGLAGAQPLSPLQRAFRKHHALQCGFCTPGMLISCQDLLDRNRDPSREEVVEVVSAHLCRCTGYVAIVDAVLDAAKQPRESK